MSEEQPASAPQIGWKTIVGPAAFFFAIVFAYTIAFYYPFPRHDHWYVVTLMQASADQTLSFQDLFEIHGGHWHASGYVIMLLSAQLTGLSHLAEVLASLGLLLLGFVGLARILSFQAKQLAVSAPVIGLFAIAAFFLFSVDQSENLLWGWQVAVFASTCGAIWSIERLTVANLTPLNVFLAAICAAFSIYGFATGWALVPLGFILLLVRQAQSSPSGRIGLLIWTTFTLLILWHFYLAQAALSEPYTADAAPTGGAVEIVVQLLTFAISYVTSPVVRFSTDIALPFFVVSMGILAWAVILLFRSKVNVLTKFLPVLALCGYAFGAGLVTGLGRVEQYVADTAFLGRYLTFGNFFWIGVISILFLARPLVAKLPRRVFTGFIILLCVMKLGTIGNVTQKTVPRALDIRAATVEMQNCYPEVSAETMLIFEAPIQDVGDRLKYISDNDLSAFKNRGECER